MPISAAETEAVKKIVSSPVWQSASAEHQLEALRQVAPSIAALPDDQQRAVATGLGGKPFIQVQQPSIANMGQGREAPPYLGPLRPPDIHAGERFGGPMGYYTPAPFEPVRDVMKGTGAILGGIAGFGTAMAGPPGTQLGVDLFTAAGAGAGAATAGGAAEGIAYVGRRTPFVKDVVDFGTPRTMGGMASEMTTDALWNMATFGGASTVKPATRPLMTFLKRSTNLKATEEAQKVLGRGLPIGLQEVSDNLLVRLTQPTIGQAPGFIGPFRDAFRRRAEAQVKHGIDFVESIAPRTMTEPEIGLYGSSAAKQTMSYTRDVLNGAFNNLYDAAEATGIGVDTAAAKSAAQNYMQIIKSEAKPKIVERLSETGAIVKETVKIPRSTPGTRVANDIIAMPDTITAKEYRGMIDDIKIAIKRSQMSGLDTGKLVQMRQDLMEGLGDSFSGDPAVANQFKATYQDLRNKWAAAKELAKGTMGQNVGGKLAMRDTDVKAAEDLFFNSAIRDFSPSAMKDLHQLVGKDPYQRIVGRRVEQIMGEALVASKESSKDAAIKINTLNAKVLAQRFGLDDPNGMTYQTWKSTLAPLGTTMKDVRDFVEAIAVTNRLPEPRAALMQQRRVGIQGIRTLGTTVLPTMAPTGPGAGPVTALASLRVLRQWSKLITDPDVLRELTRQIREDTAFAAGNATAAEIAKRRGSAYGRLMGARVANLMIDKAPEAAGAGMDWAKTKLLGPTQVPPEQRQETRP